MNQIQTLKYKINSIFEFYLAFDRRNYIRLFGTVISISIYAFILVIGASYLLRSITAPGQNFSDYSFLFGGFFSLVAEKLQLISSVILLTYALLIPHFLSFSVNTSRLGIISCIKNITAKKWGLYLSFLFILSLSELYPSPYNNSSQLDFLNYSFSGISSFAIWFYELKQFLIYILFIIFSYLLANKNVLRFSELKKEFKLILSTVILILCIDTLALAFSNGVDLYIGNFFVLLDTKNIFGIIVGIIKITANVVMVPSIIVALTAYESRRKTEIKPTLIQSDDVLDNLE